jgi:hypothetical protein
MIAALLHLVRPIFLLRAILFIMHLEEDEIVPVAVWFQTFND